METWFPLKVIRNLSILAFLLVLCSLNFSPQTTLALYAPENCFSYIAESMKKTKK